MKKKKNQHTFIFKYTKYKTKNISYTTPCFGNMGVCNTEAVFITKQQLNSLRIGIARKLKRRGFTWFKIYGKKVPITSKPQSSRMGKGKGLVSEYIYYLNPGTVFVEMLSFSTRRGIKALFSAVKRLPFKCKLIFSNNYEVKFK